jgi:hypothetical protein
MLFYKAHAPYPQINSQLKLDSSTILAYILTGISLLVATDTSAA